MGVTDPIAEIDAVPDGVVVFDPGTGEVLDVNDRFCELLGYDPSEVVGEDTSVFAAGNGTESGLSERGDSQQADGEGPIQYAWLAETAAGEELPVTVSVTTARIDGRTVAVTTLRENAEGTLEDATYGRAPDRMPIVIWEFDLSGLKERVDELAATTDDVVATLEADPEMTEQVLGAITVTDVNREAVDFYDASSKQELVENMEQLLTEDAIDTWRNLCAWLAEGGTQYQAECIAKTVTGERRTLLISVFVTEPHEDDYSRVYMTGLDITERRQRERELRQKNEILDEFASVVSHDVATPLGVIENKARLAEMTGETAYLEDIYDATERVQQLIDELRRLSRQGKRTDSTESVSLETVARNAWQTVAKPDATLTIQSSRIVEADRDRLQQLLENLLKNAVEHGSTSPDSQARQDAVEHGSTSSQPRADDAVEHGSTTSRHVSVDGGEPSSAESAAGAVSGTTVTVTIGTLPDGFYVADDGPGIPGDDRDRVFEKGHSSRDDSMGLGLAIVRRIVEGHGWEIDVTGSETGGARFEIRTGS